MAVRNYEYRLFRLMEIFHYGPDETGSAKAQLKTRHLTTLEQIKVMDISRHVWNLDTRANAHRMFRYSYKKRCHCNKNKEINILCEYSEVSTASFHARI